MLKHVISDRCFACLDDILIFEEFSADHNRKLRDILTQLRKYNIKIEPDKCELLRPELSFLGHIVIVRSKTGLSGNSRSSRFPISHYRDQD